MTDRSSSVKLSDTSGFEINPATYDAQTDGSQKTVIQTRGSDVGVQNPLQTDGDSVYAKDIWVEQSNMNTFSGLVTDLYDNLHSLVIDSTSNNPKEIFIHFNRTIISNTLGLGAFSGNFSNTKISILTSGDLETTIVDESTNNTKYTSRTFQIPVTAGINAMRLQFYTDDEVTLSNIVQLKSTSVISRIQGVTPDNEVIDIGATLEGSLNVSVEDKAFRPLSLRMNQTVQTGLTLALDTVIDSRTITMTTGHGLIAGDWIILIQENGEPQFFFASIISVAVDVLTLDTLVPYEFLASICTITQYDPDLNKDGSINVYKAELRNPFSFSIDITRFIMHITDATAMDDSKFGGRVALPNGISLRKNIPGSGNVHYWNVKTNGGIGELSFDKAYDDKAPAGVYGFSARLTYAGQSKHGVAIRLEPGEAVELLIQDDLTLLVSFSITAEGHFNE